MERSPNRLVLLVVLGAVTVATRGVQAEDPFLESLSKIATREIRKQLREKRFPFSQAPVEGHVAAIEPETRLEAEVKQFELANDLLTATVAASGRFAIDGQWNQEVDFSALVDVKLEIAAEARFLREGDTFYIEPKLKDIRMNLAIVEAAPAELAGGKDLLSSLAVAAFNKNKDKILAEANKHLGKRKF